jgi:hypothetical protein
MENENRHIEEEKKCPNPECGALNKAVAGHCIKCGHEFRN